MAGTQITITIYNHSGENQAFLLFQDAPIPTNSPVGTVFSNVYQAGPIIESDPLSHTDFLVTNQYSAIYGTSSQAIQQNVVVESSNSQPIKLGPNGSFVGLTTINRDGESPEFDPKYGINTLTSTASGGFTFQTDSSFTPNNPTNMWFGIGETDPLDPNNVVPIQTWKALPSETNQLYPVIKFYIDTGTSEQGTCVDRTSIGQCLYLDFTGATQFEASLVLDDHGNYNDYEGTCARNGVQFSYGPLPPNPPPSF